MSNPSGTTQPPPNMSDSGREQAASVRAPGYDPETRYVIMIVEEKKRSRDQLIAALAGDHDVIEAANAKDAMEMALGRLPDLILLDIKLRGDEGLGLCRALKADLQTRKIPIIFVTNSESHDSEIDGLKLGAVDFITQPADPAILRLRVRNQLYLKHYRDVLEHLSLVDGLTGTGNRRRFQTVLDQEWRRAKRLAKPVSLIMFDIDYFKKFNDHYGHPKGDDCLQRLAHLLEAMVHRPGDSAARYGGEEFAIILPETEMTGAAIVAERIRQGVELLDIPHMASPIAHHVTISVGVATLLPANEDGPEVLIKMADDRLYEAKSAGRNCTR